MPHSGARGAHRGAAGTTTNTTIPPPPLQPAPAPRLCARVPLSPPTSAASSSSTQLTHRAAMASSTAPVARAGAVPAAEYEEALGRLSSLITQKVRAHSGNRGNQWGLMAHYVKVQVLI